MSGKSDKGKMKILEPGLLLLFEVNEEQENVEILFV